MNVNDWIAKVAQLEHPLNYEPTSEDVSMLLEIGSDPRRYLAGQAVVEVERFMWNAQFLLGEIIWNEEFQLRDREVLVRSLPALIEQICLQDAESSSAFGMWDVVLWSWDPIPDDYNRPIARAISEALLRQIASSSPSVQISALHGVNHFMAPVVSERARELLVPASPDVSRYAEDALVFRSP